MPLTVAPRVFPAVAQDEYKTASDSVRSLVPDLKIDDIRPAPMEGFVEMRLGAQLVYVSLDGKYLIDGQVIEVATRKNLTESARGEVRAARLETVSQEERVVYPATSDLRYKLDLSLEDAVFGTSVNIEIPTLVECEVCHGSGARKGR